MDNSIANFRQIIIDVLTTYHALPSIGSPSDVIEEQLIIDTERDHYQILTIGWEKGKRVYYPIFHLDIRGGKILVQEDATDYDLVGRLEEQGVPKSAIVLAFHAPYKRPYTGYAVA